MGNLYVDYDKVNMILTIKCFNGETLTKVKKLEMSEIFITSITHLKKNKVLNHDVYGMVVEERSVKESDMSTIEEIGNFDLKFILNNIILVKREEDREAVKSVLPNHYCLLIDNIDEEMRDAITIYRNI